MFDWVSENIEIFKVKLSWNKSSRFFSVFLFQFELIVISFNHVFRLLVTVQT